MARYHFTTSMGVTASRDRVWEVLADPVAHAGFWTWLQRVDVLDDGDAAGLGARHRLTFRTALPYTLVFEGEVVRADRPRLLEVRAEGELQGTGRWTLTDGPVTEVTYEWLVETTRRWMNVLAPVARPLFSWNHDVLMRDFARGLAAATGSELAHVSSSATPPDAPGFWELRPA